jgi:large subunit ribosomal protein L32
MGAQPKIKISKGRRNRRRSHDSLENPPMSSCPKCGKSRRPHFVCSYCGHYGPKPKVVKENKESKSKTKK